MYSYMSLMGLVVSLLFLFQTTEARLSSAASAAVLLTCLFGGICAIVTAIDLVQEAKRNASCNVYDLLRFVVSVVLCILVSMGCFK